MSFGNLLAALAFLPGAPLDKDLDVAFTLADEDKDSSVDVFEFIRLCTLVTKGDVKGLGKGGAKTKKKFRGSVLGKGQALSPGSDVTWKGADDDLPAGTIGKVSKRAGCLPAGYLPPPPHSFFLSLSLSLSLSARAPSRTA